MIYFSSDLHLNHDRDFVWKARGFNSVNEMNEEIIKRFNSVVTSEDDLYLLGDLCLGGGSVEAMAANRRLLSQLKGKVHHIRGNHDTDQRIEMYKKLYNFVEVSGKWADMLDWNGYHFYISHFPTITSNMDMQKPLKQVTINLMGHTHQTENFYEDNSRVYHVGADSHNCYPVSIEQIIEDIRKKEGIK